MIPLHGYLVRDFPSLGAVSIALRFGPEKASFRSQMEGRTFASVICVFLIMTVILLFELIPFIEELFRGLRASPCRACFQGKTYAA